MLLRRKAMNHDTRRGVGDMILIAAGIIAVLLLAYFNQ